MRLNVPISVGGWGRFFTRWDILAVLLILGLWSRWAITAEGLLVTVLMFGTALRSDWTVVSHQMIYILFVYFLLAAEQYDYFSVDSLLARRRS